MEEYPERQKALTTARAILEGTLDILNGCARMSYEMACTDMGNDPTYDIFRGVASECDHLPIGPDRQHWNREALLRKDEEIEKITVFYREDILIACQDLIERQGRPPVI